MKINLISIWLVLICTPVKAEWSEIVETSGANIYMDMATLQIDDDAARVWVLNDLKQPMAEGVKSLKFLYEYDCRQRRARWLQAYAYSQPMGLGAPLSISGSSPWGFPVPDSRQGITLEIVCKTVTSLRYRQKTL